MTSPSITVFTEDDANPKAIENKVVAVVGYGSQGRGQSLNLRDSGVDVRLGLDVEPKAR